MDNIEKYVCDKVQINGVHSDSVQCVYNKGYNECVMLLKDNNKIRVNIAGYQMYALVDTGSTISTINKDLFNKLCKTTDLVVAKNIKQCILANGSTVCVEKSVTVPIKLGRMTISATFFVLDAVHISMIIGCDLLNLLRARIDFKTKQFVHEGGVLSDTKCQQDNEKIRETTVGVLSCDLPINNCCVQQVNSSQSSECVLKPRVEKIHITDSDTDSTQKQKLIQLANKYEMCFANDLMELGRTNIMEYDIETVPDLKPIRLKPYNCPYKHREIMYEEIDKLLEADLIRPATNSQFGFPVILVDKPHSRKMRLVCDTRLLNEQTIIQPYKMLDFDYLLADIGKLNCSFFTLIDLSNAYRQIPLSKRSQNIVTLTTIRGDFYPTTCVYGLKNLPFTFTKMLDTLFMDIKDKFMAYFQDDIIIYSKTFDEHLDHIEEVLKRLKCAKLTAKPEKTFLCKKKVQYLGFTLSKEGITTTDENIRKVKNFPRPKKVRDVRALLGLFSFYRRHVENFGIIARPLYDLTKKTSEKFSWNEKAEEAFQTLKTKLTESPILAYPNLESKELLTLTVDSSACGIGWVLSQKQWCDKTNSLVDRPISYGSTNLKGNQTKMGSTDLELTGVCFAVSKLDCWLRGVEFVLVTDHKSLLYLMRKKLDELKPATARKLIYLQQYKFQLVHKLGSSISHVDTLSRLVPEDTSDVEEDIEPQIAAININQMDTIIKDLKVLGLQTLSLKDIKIGQKKDLFYTCMYQHLLNNSLPQDKLLARKIKRHKTNYFMNNGLLYHVWFNTSNKTVYKQLCIPKQHRQLIMELLHDVVTSGHRGVFKMWCMANKKLYWKSMYSDMKNYVYSCKLCSESNTGHAPKVPLQPLPVASSPFEIVHVDLVGFHTPSCGYKYILVIIDAFSKFVVTVALKRKTAFQTIKAIYTEWILKFGFMKHLSIVSDNGKEVCNAYSKALYDLLGINSIKTTPYKPSSNSQVERTHRSIISVLRKFVKDEPKKWVSYLPFISSAINSSVSQSTKCSPFRLVHGVECTDVLDLCLPEIPENIPKNEQQAYNYWSKNLLFIRKWAKENIISAKEVQKKNYDRHARNHNFSVNDKVYIKIHKMGENDDPKLNQKYKGPYTITKFISSTNVTLVDDKGKTLPRSVYVNNLKKFQDRRSYNSVDNEQDSDSDSTIITGNELVGDTLIDSDLDKSQSEDTDINNVNEPICDMLPFSSEDTVSDSQQHDSTTTSDKDSITGNRGSTADNCEQVSVNNGEFHEIYKVYRKRTLSSGEEQYYISWKHAKAKRDRCWVNRSDLTPQLKQYVDNKKLPVVKQRINVLSAVDAKNNTNKVPSTTVMTKYINNNDDWLSLYHKFQHPVMVQFVCFGDNYECTAYSINDLHEFLCKVLKQNIGDVTHIDVLKNRLLCWCVKQVVSSNVTLSTKLDNTNGLYIINKQGSSAYATILMLLREQNNLNCVVPISIDMCDIKNPIHHLYGNILDTFLDHYLLPSTLFDIPHCFPDLLPMDLSAAIIDFLSYLDKNTE